MHRFILHNDDIRPSSDKLLAPGQVGLLSGWGVFSTIRVVEGVLFAFERHWERMHRDARLLRVPFSEDPDYIHSRLLKLIDANGVKNATLRVIVVRNKGGIWEGPNDRDFDLIGFTAKLKDWGTGVKLGIEPRARYTESPFSGAKILAWAQNLVWLEKAQCKGYDEVILLNERGEVSECTSANIFMSLNGTVYTPPLDSGCLPGVTRDIICHELRVAGAPVVEKALFPEELYAADEVFITSTTRDLLPVTEIEGRKLRHKGETREALNKAFGHFMDEYVASHKRPVLAH